MFENPGAMLLLVFCLSSTVFAVQATKEESNLILELKTKIENLSKELEILKNEKVKEDCNCDLSGIESDVKDLKMDMVSQKLEISLLQTNVEKMEPIGTIDAWVYNLGDGTEAQIIPYCKYLLNTKENTVRKKVGTRT